jgi:hypothetical protein
MFSMENHCIVQGNLYNLSPIHPYLEAINQKPICRFFPVSDAFYTPLLPLLLKSDLRVIENNKEVVYGRSQENKNRLSRLPRRLRRDRSGKRPQGRQG